MELSRHQCYALYFGVDNIVCPLWRDYLISASYIMLFLTAVDSEPKAIKVDITSNLTYQREKKQRIKAVYIMDVIQYS